MISDVQRQELIGLSNLCRMMVDQYDVISSKLGVILIGNYWINTTHGICDNALNKFDNIFMIVKILREMYRSEFSPDCNLIYFISGRGEYSTSKNLYENPKRKHALQWFADEIDKILVRDKS